MPNAYKEMIEYILAHRSFEENAKVMRSDGEPVLEPDRDFERCAKWLAEWVKENCK